MNESSHSSLPRDATTAMPTLSGANQQSLARAFRAFLARLRRGRHADASIRDAIEELIEESTDETTAINADERLLLQNILHLRDVTAYDVMVPRADITAVEATTPLPELIDLMTREAHSRLPVYRDTLDDVLGFIHIKDVLAQTATQTPKSEPFDLAAILRKVLFVSPSMRVLDLLLEMRLSRVHMALVVDEYGGIDGLVTIEDLIEAIVGDIQDEHDAEEPGMIDRPDGTILADARTEIADFETKVGSVLTDEERDADIDTLGGLVVFLAGRVPTRGEVVRHTSGLRFEIIDSDPRRVKRLRIRLPKPERSASAQGAAQGAPQGAASDGTSRPSEWR